MPRLRSLPTVVARDGDLIVENDPERPSGRLLLQGDMEASYVDLGDPTHLEFDYMRWMRIVLDVTRARRNLHVGGSACALPRALAATTPDGLQEVCERDARVLELVRAHMGLRRTPGLRVRHAEGRAHVARQADDSFDAVVVDAFEGALVPRSLITVQALGDVARVAPLALVNVVDDRSARDVLRVAAGLDQAYAHVWTLGGRLGNTVVCGAAQPPPLQRIGAAGAADRSPAALGEPERLRPQIAATAPLLDSDR